MDNKKPTIFVITPFNEDFLALYEELKKQFEGSFIFTNAGDMDNQQNIIKDIVMGISLADVIIADLSGLNANVFYELGLAHAMNKKVIIITQDIGELPFDIKSYRANEYSLKFNKISLLFDELKKLLNGAIDGSVVFGNPVSDYLPNYFLDNKDKSERCCSPTDENTPIDEATKEDGENGFIDFAATIIEKSDLMTKELISMSEDMKDMSNSVSKSNLELERVNKFSGSADATYMRNLCRKLADPISSCSEKFNLHISNIGSFWSDIENSYLELLDNKFTQKKENIESLKHSFISLENLQDTIDESNTQIESFVCVINNFHGFERRLNKAITMISNELQAYLLTTETMRSSIDRIIGKGEAVLSSIEAL